MRVEEVCIKFQKKSGEMIQFLPICLKKGLDIFRFDPANFVRLFLKCPIPPGGLKSLSSFELSSFGAQLNIPLRLQCQ